MTSFKESMLEPIFVIPLDHTVGDKGYHDLISGINGGTHLVIPRDHNMGDMGYHYFI
ncbi:hypothetical protein DPMN_145556 [Dreissena polymorpha]|uniref:Uncharacterized protein n=1 Tax=Dreissena polymorpha TaxID=45954 RepID=A0A9D4IXM1_DREPO|nr:hypothetical protein DPMN_145556 [Dreissena polymorpha]